VFLKTLSLPTRSVTAQLRTNSSVILNAVGEPGSMQFCRLRTGRLGSRRTAAGPTASGRESLEDRQNQCWRYWPDVLERVREHDLHRAARLTV
jgi:hypothetical protein